MNCFFCNSKLDHEDTACHNMETHCWQRHVVHCFFGLYKPQLFKVEFTGYALGKDLIISYLVTPNKNDTEVPSLTVTERITPPYVEGDESVTINFRYKKMIQLPFPPITLTPLNYAEKLKTYLLFS